MLKMLFKWFHKLLLKGFNCVGNWMHPHTESSSLTNPHTRRPLRRRLIMVIRFGGVTDLQQII